MIILESKLIDEIYVEGYYLTIDDLEELVTDYAYDQEIGTMQSKFTDKFYIETWLKKHNRIVKKV